MINTNYVPEWYISPFEHVKYTLARNQMHMDLLFDDMSDSDEFMSMGCSAQVDYYDGGKHCIVQLGETQDKSLIAIHGLLVHEAVHIWQRTKYLMGEKEPSIEFEAYSIQRIAQDLFDMYEASESHDQKENPIQSSKSL